MTGWEDPRVTFSVSLAVPVDIAFESLVGAFIDDSTKRAEMPETQREAVRSAVTTALSLLAGEAIHEAEGPLHMHLTQSPQALDVSLTQRGLPIDQRYAARDSRWQQILSLADRVSLRWLGKHGTELLLTFKHSASAVIDGVSPTTFDNAVVAAPEQTYTVRRFTGADAPGVSRCFYATYGYDYDFPAVYEPRRLRQLNASDEYVSFVALDKTGEVVAHYALHRERGAPIAEGCGAIVDPRHRGRHLLESLRSQAESHAREIGLAAYYTEPVTDHPITQLESEKFGAKITAISLAYSPRTMLAKHMELTATSQRQSLTFYVKPLRPAEPRVVYAPVRHREMLARLYAQLDIAIEMAEGHAADGDGTIQTSVDKASQNATITIESVGAATGQIARQAIIDLRTLASLGAIYAMLPLDDPGTPMLADELEREGLFFSGLAPWMHTRGDALRLQLPLQPLDTAKLTIAGEFGRELLSYIDGVRTSAITL